MLIVMVGALGACTADVEPISEPDLGATGGARTGGARGFIGTGGSTAPGTGGILMVGSGGTTTASGGATTATGATTGTGGLPASGGATQGGRPPGTGGISVGPTGGSVGNPAVCSFASGLNVAWVKFAGDVPNPSMAAFQTLFKSTHDAGGRVIRWWLHTNGTVTPGYDAAGMAMPLSQAAIKGVTDVLGWAHTAGVAIDLSLWSFDMLQGGENISTTLRNNNRNLLTMDANRQAYIDNVLTPLVKAVKGNPGLYSWEIFNEPEGMTAQNGWTGSQGGVTVDESFIQRTVNWFAAAIRAVDPTALITNGSWTFKACSTGVTGMTNYYSDSALRMAGGKQSGTLDFYEVHYYTLNGSQYSPFLNPATHWGLDKKVLMGEFYAQPTEGVATNDIYTKLYSTGYNGAWAWQYNDGGPATKWPSMQAPMQAVSTAHPAEVGSCP